MVRKSPLPLELDSQSRHNGKDRRDFHHQSSLRRDVTVELKCHICGRAVELPIWAEEFERLKVADDPAFICEACQKKIRVDAQNDRRS